MTWLFSGPYWAPTVCWAVGRRKHQIADGFVFGWRDKETPKQWPLAHCELRPQTSLFAGAGQQQWVERNGPWVRGRVERRFLKTGVDLSCPSSGYMGIINYCQAGEGDKGHRAFCVKSLSLWALMIKSFQHWLSHTEHSGSLSWPGVPPGKRQQVLWWLWEKQSGRQPGVQGNTVEERMFHMGLEGCLEAGPETVVRKG